MSRLAVVCVVFPAGVLAGENRRDPVNLPHCFLVLVILEYYLYTSWAVLRSQGQMILVRLAMFSASRRWRKKEANTWSSLDGRLLYLAQAQKLLVDAKKIVMINRQLQQHLVKSSKRISCLGKRGGEWQVKV
ncbi:hypothetical protein RRG08_066115 [Elysia crispata]|uniref:Secreted protein n=1 Tax=Elysia crispata TaxID=231223 RepID=A0AAE0YBN9_9GAST|nr:hypothetical protein RRG08_066115 [Elysia crispata]